MSLSIFTQCPTCQHSLEIPAELDNVICANCATAYWIRRYQGALNLSEMWPDAEDSPRGKTAMSLIDSRLAEFDELIEEAESEIESLKSRELSAPLQKGCAFFGLFMMVILVIVLFMLLGKSYLGGWLFFATVAAVLLLGMARIRRKFASSAQVQDIRYNRLKAEDALGELRSKRDRISQLKDRIGSEGIDDNSPEISN